MNKEDTIEKIDSIWDGFYYNFASIYMYGNGFDSQITNIIHLIDVEQIIISLKELYKNVLYQLQQQCIVANDNIPLLIKRVINFSKSKFSDETLDKLTKIQNDLLLLKEESLKVVDVITHKKYTEFAKDWVPALQSLFDIFIKMFNKLFEGFNEMKDKKGNLVELVDRYNKRYEEWKNQNPKSWDSIILNPLDYKFVYGISDAFVKTWNTMKVWANTDIYCDNTIESMDSIKFI